QFTHLPPYGGSCGILADSPETPALGGGSITILAKGSVVVASGGSISANGMSGADVEKIFGSYIFPSSGGGGGLILIASQSGISVQGGTLNAAGGSSVSKAPEPTIYTAGGRGGGLIKLLAPMITEGRQYQRRRRRPTGQPVQNCRWFLGR